MTTTSPAERDQQIAAMLRAGATYTQITRELGVGNNTVRRVRATLGIPVPSGRAGSRPLTDTERATLTEQRHPRAAAMLRAGFTHQQIADACGIGAGTVTDIRRALNIPVPPGRPGPKGPRPALALDRQALDDQIAELLTAGHTNAYIRAHLHVSSARVTRVLHERSIPLPPERARYQRRGRHLSDDRTRTDQAHEPSPGDTP
ncbi:hypothetical protein ACIQJT_02340 [Streptomyces sp. NPDC091972]|uniref:hypothetical protein n=1 Tax=Streptomyces sp. NPDC091972 TaxID=3366007 RepID=UPI0037F4B371